jgi:oligopeptide/dipeptide ABC transporter ATP-binding protein
MSTPAVEARSLGKQFMLRRRSVLAARTRIIAVEDVSFCVLAGRTFGLVGESGSGKTTIAKMLLKLEKPTSGALLHEGADIHAQDKKQERNYRRSVQAVLQDPYGALSPRLSIGMIIAEPMLALGIANRREAIDNARRMLELVGLRSDAADQYPHQFSGGQRQRIAIARALSINPKILVLDEPVSALDVSVRAQILQLLKEMQERLRMTYIFVGHDLATVRYMSDDLGVMYFGRLVETGSARDIFKRPLHPYTRKLVALSNLRDRITTSAFEGELPDPTNPPGGCSFHRRCRFSTARCRDEAPALRSDASHRLVACHHFEDIEIGRISRDE